MKGIAMSIIGATLVWASVQRDSAGVLASKRQERGASILLAAWFIATLVVVAGGW